MFTRAREIEIAIPGSRVSGDRVEAQITHFSPFAAGFETLAWDYALATKDLVTYGLSIELEHEADAFAMQTPNGLFLSLAVPEGSASTNVLASIAGLVPLESWQVRGVEGLQEVAADSEGHVAISLPLPSTVRLHRSPGTIFLNSFTDCSATAPDNPPVALSGRVCSLTSDIDEPVVIRQNGMIFDCNGWDIDVLHHPAAVFVDGEEIIVTGCEITTDDTGIEISPRSARVAIESNEIVGGATAGVLVDRAEDVVVRGNEIGLTEIILIPGARVLANWGVLVRSSDASVRDNLLIRLGSTTDRTLAAVAVVGSGTVAVEDNLFRNLKGEALRLEGATAVEVVENDVRDVEGPALVMRGSPSARVFHNNLRPPTGVADVSPHAVLSDRAHFLDDGGEGNFWKPPSIPPLFSPGVTSDRIDVVDRFPFCEANGWLSSSPCTCSGAPVSPCSATTLLVSPSVGTWESAFEFDARPLISALGIPAADARVSVDIDADGTFEVANSGALRHSRSYPPFEASYQPVVEVRRASQPGFLATRSGAVTVLNPAISITEVTPSSFVATLDAEITLRGTGFAETMFVDGPGDLRFDFSRDSSEQASFEIPAGTFVSTSPFDLPLDVVNPGNPPVPIVLRVLTGVIPDPPEYLVGSARDGPVFLAMTGISFSPGVVVTATDAVFGDQSTLLPVVDIGANRLVVRVDRSVTLERNGYRITIENPSGPVNSFKWPRVFPQPEIREVRFACRIPPVSVDVVFVNENPELSDCRLEVDGLGTFFPGTILGLAWPFDDVSLPQGLASADLGSVGPLVGDVAATFRYPLGPESPEFLLPVKTDPRIHRAEPRVVFEGRPQPVRLIGQDLAEFSFEGRPLRGQLRVPGPVLDVVSELEVPIESFAPDGSFIDVVLPLEAVQNGGLTLRLSATLRNARSVRAEIPVLGRGLGEHEPRTNLRVTRDREFRRPEAKNVGSSVYIQRSKRLESMVDVAINTWTDLEVECLTELQPASEPFRLGQNFLQALSTPTFGTRSFPWKSGSVEFRRHRVQFSGLPKGELFHYRVSCVDLNTGFGFAAANDSYFRTPPSVGSAEVQVAFVGDHIKSSQPEHYHDDGYDGAGEPRLEWQEGALHQSFVVQQVDHARRRGLVDFVLQGGDLVDEVDAGGHYFNYLYRYHSMWEEILAGTPTFVVGGNHDARDLPFPNPSEEYFEMVDGPRDAPFAAPLGRQFFSFDWGDVQVVGLDFIAHANVDVGLFFDQRQAGLGLFAPGTAQREFFDNTNAAGPAPRWRIVYSHGAPQLYESVGSTCGASYEGFCDAADGLGVDLLLNAHGSYGVWRHRSPNAPPPIFVEPPGTPDPGRVTAASDHFIYSFRSVNGGQGISTIGLPGKQGFAHLRARPDALILSYVWTTVPRTAGQLVSVVPPTVPFAASSSTPSAIQSGRIGALMECYKYVPGVKRTSDCEFLRAAAGCVSEAETLLVRDDQPCTDHARVMCGGDQMAGGDTGGFALACCKDWDGDNVAAGTPQLTQEARRCTGFDFFHEEALLFPRPPGARVEGNEVVCDIEVEACDKAIIAAVAPECLRRQVIPIVTSNWRPDDVLGGSDRIEAASFVHVPELVSECTPCRDHNGRSAILPDGSINPLFDITSVTEIGPECGKVTP